MSALRRLRSRGITRVAPSAKRHLSAGWITSGKKTGGENRAMDARLPDLRGAGLLEASHFAELFVPVPKHESQSHQRRSDTQEPGKEKESEKDQIDDSSCHLNTLRL